jgi:hypothetical protein
MASVKRLSSLFGLFFAIYELDAGNYLWGSTRIVGRQIGQAEHEGMGRLAGRSDHLRFDHF